MSQKAELKEKIDKVIEKSKTLPKNIVYRNNEFDFGRKKLEEEAEKDLKMDRDNLAECQQKAPIYMHRYLRIMQDFIRKLKFYQRIMNELSALKYEWYKVFYDYTVEKKSEVDIYIKGDRDVLNIQEKIDECSEIIEYLKDVCDRFSNRSYEINNIIEWEKFIHGEK